MSRAVPCNVIRELPSILFAPGNVKTALVFLMIMNIVFMYVQQLAVFHC